MINKKVLETPNKIPIFTKGHAFWNILLRINAQPYVFLCCRFCPYEASGMIDGKMTDAIY